MQRIFTKRRFKLEQMVSLIHARITGYAQEDQFAEFQAKLAKFKWLGAQKWDRPPDGRFLVDVEVDKHSVPRLRIILDYCTAAFGAGFAVESFKAVDSAEDLRWLSDDELALEPDSGRQKAAEMAASFSVST